LDLVFHDKQQLLDIQSKSAGLILLMKIFLNIRNGELKIGEEINSLFFKNLSREIGISISHTRNLITLLVDGGFIERENGVSYVIRDSLIKGIEEVISLQLASDYYFIHDFIYNDRK
jgi:DNA-binding transcriptional regulator YhcF (GntR family)